MGNIEPGTPPLPKPPLPPPNVIPTPTEPLKGFDVSHYQGALDFGQMFRSGYKFCFVKATEGLISNDSQFQRSWIEAPKAGILIGAYHFFHPSLDPAGQAEHFVKALGPARGGDLPCVLDWEVSDNIRATVQAANAIVWLEAVERLTGKTPIIYGSPGFFEALGDLSAFAKYRLWIAHYGVATPRIPKPWKTYTFWQTSSSNNLDKNVFNGSLADLQALAGKAPLSIV